MFDHPDHAAAVVGEDDVAMSSTVTHRVEVVPTAADKPAALFRYLSSIGQQQQQQQQQPNTGNSGHGSGSSGVLGGRECPSVLVFCNRVDTAVWLAELLGTPAKDSAQGGNEKRNNSSSREGMAGKQPSREEEEEQKQEQQTKRKRQKQKKKFGRGGRGGYRAAVLHGKMPQGQREETLQRFAAGQVQVLVATDLVARGLHLNGLAHVVNFDLPHEGRVADQSPHRAGRTGRSGSAGTTTTLLAGLEDMGGGGSEGSGGGDGGAVRELVRLFTSSGVPVDPSLVELLGEDGNSEDDPFDSEEEDDEEDENEDEDDSNGDGSDEYEDSDDDDDDDDDEEEEEENEDDDDDDDGKSWTRRDLQEELVTFYSEHAPEKLEQVDELVEKYWGKVNPRALLRALEQKYS